ncbi:Very-long-chain 3-oxoacyl-CoA reductase-like protein [Arachis hypogaea]|nr:Very-long-chain 3-oxoacyl-CoA reductase-like protein [Arachis hypogaea]
MMVMNEGTTACSNKDGIKGSMHRERFTFHSIPEAYAKAAVREIGHGPRCTPYWAHSIQWFFAGLAPDSLQLLNAWRFSIAMRRWTGIQ